MKRGFSRIAAVLVASVAAAAFAGPASFTEKGIAIDGGSVGKFTLSYPALTAGGKPSSVKVADNSVDLTYANGAKIHATLAKNGDLLCELSSLPADTKKLRMELSFPESIKGNAKWTIDAIGPKEFPEGVVEGAFMFKADAKKFTVATTKDDKQGFLITMPHGFMQLQDNRFWKGKDFSWFTALDIPGAAEDGKVYVAMKVAGLTEAASKDEPAKSAPAKAAPAAKLASKLTGKGLVISNGTAGDLTLSFPKLAIDSKQVGATETNAAADGKSVNLKYPNGASAAITLQGSDLKIAFRDLPKNASAFRIESLIPFNYSTGGTYTIGGGTATAFPKDKPAKAFLYQGNSDKVTLVHPTGPGLTITVPAYSYQQLQDNREWNWSVFGWHVSTPIQADQANQTFSIKVEQAAAGASQGPMIDRFGQWVSVDYPSKVKSVEELKQDIVSEKEWLASLKPPAADTYGGLAGSGEKLGLKKTGFFHLANIKRPGAVGGNTDILVTPEGNAFFQLGVCGISPCDDFTTVSGRESIYEWIPGRDKDTLSARREGQNGIVSFYLANTIRKFGQPYDLNTHFGRWIERLRAWGFNSAGAFNARPEAAVEKNFPFVTFLPMPAPKLGTIKDVWDPFAPDLEAKFDAAYAKSVAPKAGDPLLIGYFICNEPLIEDVPKTVPTLKASKCPSKAKLIAMMQEKYRTIEAFNTAWNTKAASFEDAGEQALTITSKAAADDMGDFFKLFLETRYSLVRNALRKHDPNHLLIGDRWMPGTANSEILVKTAAKYLDVVSINYYTYGVDKNFLERIHTWAGRPLLFSEWYFACADRGLRGGNKVNTQTERGLAYRNYIEQSAATGYVVGSQWFLALDQAATGRFFEGFNGEAANTGLVDVADRPYKEFLDEVMKTNYTVYDVILGNRPAFAFDDPRFAAKRTGAAKNVSISRMVNKFVLDGSRSEWPSVPPYRIGADGLAQGRDANGFEATFRVAYDETNLYLFIEVTDTTPMKNVQKPEAIWNGDAIELFTGHEDLKQGGSLKFSDRQTLIRGAKTEEAGIYFGNAPKQYEAQTIVTPNLDGKGYTVEGAIPFEALGFSPKDVTEFLFDIAVDDGDGKGRTRQLVFNGHARNSKDRGAWGRATLVK